MDSSSRTKASHFAVSRPLIFFSALFLVVTLTRLCHTSILWPEEDLPLAAAMQMRDGRMLYGEVWFDKPPLLPALYLLWNAEDGVALRLAGALYMLFACGLAWRFALDLWGEREAFWSAGLMAFFLTFDTPAVVMPLAADLTMLVPHLAAVYFAFRRNSFWSGLFAGLAFLTNAKGLMVLVVCAIWNPAGIPLLLAGFAVPNALSFVWLFANGAWTAYIQQVWEWPRVYAQDTFLENPMATGLTRSINWLGFHAVLAVAAAISLFRREVDDRWKWAAWIVLSFSVAALGLRFFPRYFLQALPALVLLGARGLSMLQISRRPAFAAVVLLLVVPLIRFGPRYGLLAADLFSGRDHEWSDVAMDRDSQRAAFQLRRLADPDETLLVWGFRPEFFVYSGLQPASRFLESQPLTGVAADRHLNHSRPQIPELASANRRELAKTKPVWIVDGLGPYNPALAITSFPDLKEWLKDYEIAFQTKGSVVYHRNSP